MSESVRGVTPATLLDTAAVLDSAAPVEIAAVPFRITPEMLADRIERVIRWRTAGRIRDLKVENNRAGVYLSGNCATYYLKQLAQHAAMELAGGEQVINDIQVR